MGGLASAEPTPKASSTPSKARRRVLCYGDSLTAGFCSGGRKFTPYGPSLAEALRAADCECEVSFCGLSSFDCRQMITESSGASVMDGVGQTGKGLEWILANEGPYELAVIMAGTNDIGRQRSPDEFLKDLGVLHNICHARGVKTLALAPPHPCTGPRGEFVELLRPWAHHHAEVLAYVDPEELVPRSEDGFWEKDMLHLSPKGSSTLGKRLASYVRTALPSAKDNSPQSMRSSMCSAPRWDSLDDFVVGTPSGKGNRQDSVDSSPEKSARRGTSSLPLACTAPRWDSLDSDLAPAARYDSVDQEDGSLARGAGELLATCQAPRWHSDVTEKEDSSPDKSDGGGGGGARGRPYPAIQEEDEYRVA